MEAQERINIKELKAHKVFGPGYFIQRQMDARGWTQKDLADVLGVSAKEINYLLQNKQSITFETAQLLENAFGISAQTWLNHELRYRESKQTGEKKARQVKIKSPIYEFMPINEMVKKGWLLKAKKAEELERQVMDFWGSDSVDFDFMRDTSNLRIACKKSDTMQNFNLYALKCWQQKATLIARRMQTGTYDRHKLEELFNDISYYTVDEKDGIRKFLNELNDCGVKFVVLSHLQHTYLDGATFMDNGTPIIVYTGRYKRLDNFWFTLAHEIAHILLHLKGNICFVDDESHSNEVVEKEANELAQSKLKHNEIVSFFRDHKGYLTQAKLDYASKILEINGSIIAGSLAHDGIVSYGQLNANKKNPLELMPKCYLAEQKTTID